MTAPRTLHTRLKFDHGLTAGPWHAVTIQRADGKQFAVLVRIPARGFPRIMRWDGPGDMYISTYRVNPDDTTHLEGVRLASQHAEEFQRLARAPLAVIPLTV